MIIPSSDALNPPVLSSFLPALEKANALAPRHSQVPPELVVFLPGDAAFPKASKGSLQRGQAYDAFQQDIDAAYARFEGGEEDKGENKLLNVKGEELKAFVRSVVEEAVGGIGRGSTKGVEIGLEEDLFAFGVNSLQSVRIRNVLQKVIRRTTMFRSLHHCLQNVVCLTFLCLLVLFLSDARVRREKATF